MKRPTIKQLQDLAFAIHADGLSECIYSHEFGSLPNNGGLTVSGCMARGKAMAFRDASKRLRDLIDPPQPAKKEPKK